MIDDISPDTMRILKACAGKNLPECCLGDLVPGMRWSDAKRELIDDLNRQLGTNYNVNHLNNWIAGRVETPKRA
nr:hypothetical protein [Spirochaetales bacterium]